MSDTTTLQIENTKNDLNQQQLPTVVELGLSLGFLNCEDEDGHFP